MKNREAIKVFDKWIDCKDAYQADPSCDGRCYSCEYHTSAEEEREAMQMAISALEKQEQDRWIPCTQTTMPDTDEELWSDCVLVTRRGYYPNGKEWYVVEKASYCEKLLSSDGRYRDTPGWAIGKDAYSTDCIIAWMPLPRPYAEEEA